MVYGSTCVVEAVENGVEAPVEVAAGEHSPVWLGKLVGFIVTEGSDVGPLLSDGPTVEAGVDEG
jgi:hypothetical protein